MVRPIPFRGRLFFVCMLLFASIISSVSQTIEPSPLIRHYSANIQDLHSIWKVAPTPSGSLLLAGGDCLAEYDGHQFKKLLSGTFFSLAIDPDDHTVYIGTDKKFGYLEKDKLGSVKLNSLSDQIPNSTWVEEVRHVIITKRKVFFLSQSYVFEFNKSNRKFVIYPLPGQIRNGFAVGDSLFVGDSSKGLLVLYNNKTSLAPFGSFFKGKYLQSATALPSGQHVLGWNELILYDHTGKIPPAPYSLKAGNQKITANAYSYTSLQGKYDLIAHDGSPGGATIIDRNKNILFNYKGTNELSANDLIGTAVDHQKNFWLSYYFTSGGGLTKLEHGQDIKIWSKENGLPSVLSITRFKGKLFVSTPNGLFRLDEDNRLIRLPESDGIYYGLFSVKLDDEERLLVFNSHEIKEWTGKEFITIITDVPTGFIVFQTLNNPPRLMVMGTTRSYSYQKGKWIEDSPLPNLVIEQFTETEDGSVWVQTHDGIARIETNTVPFRTSTITYPDEIKDELTSYIFTSPTDDVLIGTNKGLYAINQSTNQMIPWNGFGKAFAERNYKVSYSKRLSNTSYLITSNKTSESLIYSIIKSDTIITDAPFKRLPDKGNTDCVWYDADGTVWLGGTYGLISYNPRLDIKDYHQPFNCLIQKVKVAGDSTILTGALSFIKTEEVQPELSYDKNQIQFEFAAPFFDKEEETLYSYRLLGMTDKWSEWDKVYYKEYSNLNENTYTFQVKAKNIYGVESAVATYSFTILPPWYRTWWAYAFYLILAVIGITLLIRQRTNYLNQRRKELEKIVEQQTGELKSSNEELKATNDSLLMTQRKLVASEKMASLGQLTAGIAHEINNPINFISGGVQALSELQHDLKNKGHLLSKEELQVKNNEIEELMISIMNGVNRTSDIIKSLREFSSPYDELDDTACTDVPECISNSLLLLNSRIKDAGIVVTTDFAVHSYAHAISAQVSQVIINLVDNSIYAVLQKSDRQIKITAEETHREIVIRVIDNGTGIPADKQSHIFEPFFTTKTVGKGIGLGLFICYSIIQKQGGSLTFESNSNGTTFTIALPKKVT